MLCSAQNSSLTKDFAKLSAKERTKLAKQEIENAAKDARFIELMSNAESAFRARDYDEALGIYKEARHRRPLNVNPKVKIEDLEALIAQQNDRSVITQSSTTTFAVPILNTSITVEKPAPKKIPMVPAESSQTDPSAEQRIYRMGNALILERSILEENRLVNYRRVQHNWGGIFFFRENTPISESRWNTRFGES